MKENPRLYGCGPLRCAVVHGGPGAAGEMAPVARELSSHFAVLEPLQTEMTVDGQVSELKVVLESHAQAPVTLVGHSWGSWLALMVAARFPRLTKKLILVGSPPFDERYVSEIEKRRMSRFSETQAEEYKTILRELPDATSADRERLFFRLGALTKHTDSYETIDLQSGSESLLLNGEVFQSVWTEAAKLRRNGSLIELSRQVTCPVLAIQGDYDPHPAEGVESPLSAILANFRFITLKKCGHTPWLEKNAANGFFRLLLQEM